MPSGYQLFLIACAFVLATEIMMIVETGWQISADLDKIDANLDLLEQYCDRIEQKLGLKK